MTRAEKGVAKHLTDVSDLLSVTMPTAVKTRHDKQKRLATEWLPRASQDRADAEAALSIAEDEQSKADILEMVDSLKGKSPKPPELGPDKVHQAAAEARRARRRLKAARGATAAITRDLEQEVSGPEFTQLLAKWWAEFVSFPVRSNMSLSEYTKAESVSDQAARLIESIALTAAHVNGMSHEEEKRLKRAFRDRPPEMPTIEDVRAAMRSEQRATPVAQDQKRRAAAKAAGKPLASAAAQLAARARNPEQAQPDPLELAR